MNKDVHREDDRANRGECAEKCESELHAKYCQLSGLSLQSELRLPRVTTPGALVYLRLLNYWLQ